MIVDNNKITRGINVFEHNDCIVISDLQNERSMYVQCELTTEFFSIIEQLTMFYNSILNNIQRTNLMDISHEVSFRVSSKEISLRVKIQDHPHRDLFVFKHTLKVNAESFRYNFKNREEAIKWVKEQLEEIHDKCYGYFNYELEPWSKIRSK